MLHASIDAFKLFEIPGGAAGVLFSISLATVSILVPLGVLVVGNRFFGRKPSPGSPAKSSRTRQPLVLWRQTWT